MGEEWNFMTEELWGIAVRLTLQPYEPGYQGKSEPTTQLCPQSLEQSYRIP